MLAFRKAQRMGRYGGARYDNLPQILCTKRNHLPLVTRVLDERMYTRNSLILRLGINISALVSHQCCVEGFSECLTATRSHIQCQEAMPGSYIGQEVIKINIRLCICKCMICKRD